MARLPRSVLFLAALFLPSSAVMAQQAGGEQQHGMDHVVPVLVSTDWLAERLDHRRLIVLHVAMGGDGPPETTIPGARFLDYYDVVAPEANDLRIEFRPVDEMAQALRAVGVNNDSHVVLAGPRHLPARIYVALDYLGLGDRTSVLDGGVRQWAAEERDLSEQFATSTAGSFQPDVQDDVLVTMDWIRERVDDPSVTLIDARPLDEYTGERPGEGLRPGHIPGAYNLYWEDLQVSQDEPVLKPIEQVMARFEESGSEEGGLMVSYCAIGMRASYTYLISKHLGYDARFYDGSWNEWGAQDDTPAVTGTARR